METPEGPTVGVSSTLPADMPDAHARIPVWNPENRFYAERKHGHRVRAACEVFKGEGDLVRCCEHLQTVKFRIPADFEGRSESKSEQKPS